MPAAFANSFLSLSPSALRFLPAAFRDPAERLRHAEVASRRVLAPGMEPVLRAQDAALPPSAARRQNIDALARPGTTAVISGQQVGLFLGPLYTFYKAASAIAVARAIERESGTRCVPVFWLQTEDHDFPEINHCMLQRVDSAPCRLEINDLESAAKGSAGERISVAHRRLGGDVEGALAQLEAAVGQLPCAEDFLALLRAHYRPGCRVAGAFAAVIATLFADEGLIVFDPRCAEVARLAAPVYRKAIADCDGIAHVLAERSRALREAGFAEQVRIRPGVPLAFVHREGVTGPRYRLERRGRAGNDWSYSGFEEVIAGSELDALIDREPLRLSTSALLRPIVQDVLFPTVAYVGGPGEINYYAQLAPLYARFDLPVPLITPRARFRCIEARIQSLLDTLGLKADDAALPRRELLERVAAPLPSDQPTPVELKAKLLAEFGARLDDFEQRSPSVDPNLSSAVRRTRGTVHRAVDRLVQRYGRSLLERDHVKAGRVDRVQRALYPDGVPQERYYGLAWYACKYGWREFKARIEESLDPFSGASRDIDL